MKAIEEFNSISSDDELYALIKRYGFVRSSRPTSGQVLGIYSGKLDSQPARLTHRWYDPSGPFQNEPDIHKAELVVEGHGSHQVAYRE